MTVQQLLHRRATQQSCSLGRSRRQAVPNRLPTGGNQRLGFASKAVSDGDKGDDQPGNNPNGADVNGQAKAKVEGPSTDMGVIVSRLSKLVMPYWTDKEVGKEARWRLAGLLALTLGTTGVSVIFNFLGRDFFNAISEKNVDAFWLQLAKYLGGFALGIPVYVFRSYFQSRLALSWRQWLTQDLLKQYFEDRTFYQLQVNSTVDNPDQRVSSDVRTFTDTALGLSVTILNATVDLISFSGILFSIYPPLFGVLVVYASAGTAASIALGRNLVTLNFNQEAREADFRYNLVRVRENAESVAFYGGEDVEFKGLKRRLEAAVANNFQLITASRNLDFFTSFYRYIIMLLPAAVVAPLYFRGEVEFGVITQSQSAFSHILGDVSLVVYQIEALAGFSAVVDRLGEFQEEVQSKTHLPPAAAVEVIPAAAAKENGSSLAAANGSSSGNGASSSGADTGGFVRLLDKPYDPSSGVLLSIDDLTLTTPGGTFTLVKGLSIQVKSGQSLLIMGPSGAGKTSLLRATAGLWLSGNGGITRHGQESVEKGDANGAEEASASGGQKLGGGYGDIFFLPQRPYVVLGSLRQQLLYPVWSQPSDNEGSNGSNGGKENGAASPSSSSSSGGSNGTQASSSTAEASIDSGASSSGRPVPTDSELEQMLKTVRLGDLLSRHGGGTQALNTVADWASQLSLGEQQRLAFARLLLARPLLALMDESTSALDSTNEDHLYNAVLDAGITVVSVGHRSSLTKHHKQVLLLQPAASGSEGGWKVVPAGQMQAATV